MVVAAAFGTALPTAPALAEEGAELAVSVGSYDLAKTRSAEARRNSIAMSP